MITIILFACVLWCLLIFKKFGFWDKHKSHLPSPPGAPGSLPLIGHLLYLGASPAETLMKWAGKYGQMFMIDLGPHKSLVIDDPLLMKDILNQSSFSGRLQNEIFMDISQQGHGILFSEGKTWESQRRFTIKHLRDFGFKKPQMEQLVLTEVKELISTFKEHLDKPMIIKDTFVLPVLNGLWMLTAGEKLPQQDTRLLEIWTEWVSAFNNLQATGILFAPKLRHIAPSLLGWNRFVAVNKTFIKFIEETVTHHIKTFDDKNHRDLIDSYISEIEKTGDVDSQFYKEKGYNNLHATVADIFGAGSETTSTTLNWALLYLIANPDVQEKLHKEILSVVGSERSPKLSDRPNLPYTEATICEALRISSYAPLGLLQRALHDTEFNGFGIKKGTLIIANMYSAHHNPDRWNQPELFRPERFLSPSGDKLKNPPQFVPFQVGRRQCLGESFAMDTLFLFVTSIFQNFQIFPFDKNEKLDFEAIPGFVRIPKPFSVKINSRF